MRSVWMRWLTLVGFIALSGCGGGGSDAGTPLLSNSTNQAAAAVRATDLVLVLSAPSVANNGSETVTATATAIDANRNSMAGVPVTISVNANGIATPAETTTNAQGVVTAGIGIGADRSPRSMTVTATSGSIVRTVSLTVREAGGSSLVASDLILSLSAGSISDSGTQTVTATATALDGKRNVLQGADVSLSVNSNAIIAPSGSSTNASGVVTGAIGIGNDRSNRVITVMATSGGLVRTAQLQVATQAGVGTAADLSLVLSASRLANGGTATITATATAVDSNRNALTGIPVTFKVDNSAVLVVPSTTTGAQGQLAATVGIGADRSNRVVTVTASSGSLTRSASFVVEGAELRASLSPRVNAGTVGNQIEYSLVDGNSLPMAGQSISVTAPGLASASGTTDSNGKYTYTYNAPSSTVTITAAAAGASRVSTVEVGSGLIDPAPSVPQSATVAPSPSVISVNSVVSNSNQVELRALFYGANNQPIPRVRVRFDLDGNANNSDGAIGWLGGTYAYSDAGGVARATFTPGMRASPTNGVTVRICYDVNDFDINSACPADRQARATLTVVQEALSVNIRTNELLKESASKLTYIKEFVVMVVDAAGQPKADIVITPSVDLPAYYKGEWSWAGDRWALNTNRSLADTENYQWNSATRQWVRGPTTTQPSCPQEDANRNGVRESTAFVSGAEPPALAFREEDLNWNGDLDARKSDVAIKMVGSAKTDANGLAIVQIEYGKSLATWVDFVITVTASGISGTEARARFIGTRYGIGNLPYLASDAATEAVAPAWRVSPYGKASVCTDPN
jgi:hypothetical protein